ncbi:MAG: nucleoside-diphosphate sugar epimerase/dehydratase [Acidimicrobiia bacterium]
MGGRRIARRKNVAKALLDAGATTVALVAAGVARYDFHLDLVPWGGLLTLALLAATCQVLAGIALGLYVGRWKYGSLDEVAALGRAVLLTAAFAVVVDVAARGPQMAPRSVPLVGAVAAFVAMGALRFAWRLRLDREGRRPRHDAVRLLVFGAGDGGTQVIRSILDDRSATYQPVALLDDDPGKRSLRIMGVRVAGDRTRMAEVAARYDAGVLLIAVPSASSETLGELSGLAAECGLEVKVLPPVRELFGDVELEDIRSLQASDFLGRDPITTDAHAIAGYLTGRRVLVTGAGGSIGAELCRQIDRFSPAELMMLDRDESGLHAVQLSIAGHGLLDTPHLILADIRDHAHIRQILCERRPEVVFHAAALKHLPLLEQSPAEALKSNVWGTANLLEACAAAGVDTFVNISTDKAADPVSALGYSKRIAERLTADMATRATGTYVSVRFGNVLGSRGSVLTAFRAQAEAGGPITVTHPEVTRYFMTVEEAVELVIQAAAIGRSGEVLVLDMGLPVPIREVARRMARGAPKPVDIVYTGLRPGEKLHEVLLGADEADERPFHPLISHAQVPPLDPERVHELDQAAGPDAVLASLRGLCGAPMPEEIDLTNA